MYEESSGILAFQQRLQFLLGEGMSGFGQHYKARVSERREKVDFSARAVGPTGDSGDFTGMDKGLSDG